MSTAESVPNLTPNQLLVLVVLMAEARVLSNAELKELAGCSLTGVDNATLERLGLVETDRSHRPFSHQLSDKGWHVVRQLHTVPPPKQGGSASRTILNLLANVHRSLDRLQISHGDFFKPTAYSGSAPTTDVGEVQATIRTAYHALARVPGNWVGLADLREQLANLERETVDEALRAMVGQADVRIIPVANLKGLQPRDRAAALRIGDEDNHAMLIGPA